MKKLILILLIMAAAAIAAFTQVTDAADCCCVPEPAAISGQFAGPRNMIGSGRLLIYKMNDGTSYIARPNKWGYYYTTVPTCGETLLIPYVDNNTNWFFAPGSIIIPDLGGDVSQSWEMYQASF